MRASARAGVLSLALLTGSVLGAIGTFVHQSLPPVGVVLALGTVGVFLAGLRVWASVRGPAALGTFGVAVVSGLLALPWAGGNVVVPANVIGYAWTFGVVLIALLVLAWPDTVRRTGPGSGVISPSRAVSMEEPLEEKDCTAP